MASVCVFCGSSAGIDPRYLDLARDLGTALATRGHVLVSGGAKVSMMGTLGAAARAAGGRTVGVIPNALIDWEVGDTDSDEFLVVDTMRQRKTIMEERADAFIALPGGLGTFEELFEIWTARSLDLHQKPVVALDPYGFFDPLWTFLSGLVDTGFVRRRAFELLVRARSVEEALDAAVPAGL